MVWVTEAKYIEDYSVWIKFNDTTSGTINLKQVIENDNRTIVSELIDLSLFQTVSAALDTLCWKNGADFAPEFLYDLLKKRESVA